MKPGRAATMTHDYKRHGTTTLFAAMNTLDGTVISRYEQRHRHVEWLDFLRHINRETAPDKTLHLVCDNSRLTSIRRSSSGWPSTRDSICISPPPQPPGS